MNSVSEKLSVRLDALTRRQLGVYADFDPLDNCGQIECVREAASQERAAHEYAHERLDRDMGWF